MNECFVGYTNTWCVILASMNTRSITHHERALTHFPRALLTPQLHVLYAAGGASRCLIGTYHIISCVGFALPAQKCSKTALSYELHSGILLKSLKEHYEIRCMYHIKYTYRIWKGPRKTAEMCHPNGSCGGGPRGPMRIGWRQGGRGGGGGWAIRDSARAIGTAPGPWSRP